jgi:hypothetical protein
MAVCLIDKGFKSNSKRAEKFRTVQQPKLDDIMLMGAFVAKIIVWAVAQVWGLRTGGRGEPTQVVRPSNRWAHQPG